MPPPLCWISKYRNYVVYLFGNLLLKRIRFSQVRRKIGYFGRRLKNCGLSRENSNDFLNSFFRFIFHSVFGTSTLKLKMFVYATGLRFNTLIIISSVAVNSLQKHTYSYARMLIFKTRTIRMAVNRTCLTRT